MAPSIVHVSPHQATLLGAPIGDDEEVNEILTRKIEEFERLASRLKQLCAHDAFFLLKNCFSLPKLQYILRCVPCYRSQVLQRYDSSICDTLQHILNIELSDQAWNQATLPVKSGGIGIWLATQVALPAFLSSVASSSQIILQLLPPHLHSSSGINDHLFSDAVEEWQIRSRKVNLRKSSPNRRHETFPLLEL